jgi:hypothetical protein
VNSSKLCNIQALLRGKKSPPERSGPGQGHYHERTGSIPDPAR